MGQVPPARIGVMGGTFDPIHLGHLVAASEVAAVFGLSQVVFVPTGEPYQKAAREVSKAQQRYEMTALAVASNPAFGVSRVDVDRVGPTYTVDTLRDLSAEHPGAELFFITGADALARILTWKDPAEVLRLARFVGVSRPGHALSEDALGAAGLPIDRVELLDVPALAISSTDCRQRVAAGRPIRYLVPDAVVDFISRNRLYQREATP